MTKIQTGINSEIFVLEINLHTFGKLKHAAALLDKKYLKLN